MGAIVKEKHPKVLECGHKTDTEYKPRARFAHGIWMIHGGGVATFGATQDDALRIWIECLRAEV